MAIKSIIIQGSSRSDGNTNTIAHIFRKKLDADFIDLRKLTIHPYSYEHKYSADDFLATMKQVITYDRLIFVTPVYWYSMSGIMKNFFDRLTDCLQIEKELGRSLKNKKMIAISCGSDEEETEGFFIPFNKSAEYLDMNYVGSLHTWIENEQPNIEVLNIIEVFINKIENRI